MLTVLSHSEQDIDAKLPGIDQALCFRIHHVCPAQQAVAGLRQLSGVQQLQRLLRVSFLEVAVSGAAFCIHHPALGAYLLADVEDVVEELPDLLLQTRFPCRLSSIVCDYCGGTIRLFEFFIKFFAFCGQLGIFPAQAREISVVLEFREAHGINARYGQIVCRHLPVLEFYGHLGQHLLHDLQYYAQVHRVDVIEEVVVMSKVPVQFALQFHHFRGEILAVRLFEKEVYLGQLRTVECGFSHLKLMHRILPYLLVKNEEAHPAVTDGLVILRLLSRMCHARIFVLANDRQQPYLEKFFQIMSGKPIYEVGELQSFELQFRYGRREKYRIYILYLVTHLCLPFLFLIAARSLSASSLDAFV